MKYRVYGEMTISVYTDVEAESKEEAEDIASERPPGTLAYRAFCSESKDSWLTGEFEGEIENIEAEERG